VTNIGKGVASGAVKGTFLETASRLIDMGILLKHSSFLLLHITGITSTTKGVTKGVTQTANMATKGAKYTTKGEFVRSCHYPFFCTIL
jgi:hypothetical protein